MLTCEHFPLYRHSQFIAMCNSTISTLDVSGSVRCVCIEADEENTATGSKLLAKQFSASAPPSPDGSIIDNELGQYFQLTRCVRQASRSIRMR